MAYVLPAFPNNGGQGGAHVAEWLEQQQARNQSLSLQAKSADAFRQSLGEDAETQSGITDDAWQNLGAEDKAAWHNGYQEGAALKRMQAQVQTQRDLTMARVAQYGAIAQDRQADAQASSDAADVVRRYGQLVTGSGAAPSTNDDDEEIPGDGQPAVSPSQALPMALGAMRPGADVSRALPKVMDSLAKWQAVTGTGDENMPTSMTMPDGGVVYYQPKTKNPIVVSPMTKSDARVNEIDAQASANQMKGTMPAGTTFSTTENGFGMAEFPDGTMKNLGRIPSGTKKSDFFAQFMGGGPAATAAPTAAPVKTAAAAARAAVGAYKIGTIYKGGLKYLGGDPTDRASWEQQ